MGTANKRFTAHELKLLANVKGKTLERVDACIVARGDMAWNTVRLHFEDCALDVNNRLGEITVDELGTVDEFGLMSISVASVETLDVPEASPQTTIIPVGKRVEGITVVDDIVEVFGDGNPVANIAYPQAILFDLGDEWLSLDKETWFEETIAIKAGTDPALLVYDDTINWADDPDEDPTTHYEASTQRMEL